MPAKYLIEMDELHGDCSYCPMFHREGNEEAVCGGAKKDMRSIPEQSSDKRFGTIQTFSIPDWCPLEQVSDEFLDAYKLSLLLPKLSSSFEILDEIESRR